MPGEAKITTDLTAAPEILDDSLTGPSKTSAEDCPMAICSERIEESFLQVKLDDSSSSELCTEPHENEEFESFCLTRSHTIEQINNWLEPINSIFSEIKLDQSKTEKMFKNIKRLETELKNLKRTSPIMIADKAELDRTVSVRSARLEEIKAELIIMKETFENFEKRRIDQCVRIMKTVTSFPSLLPN